MAFLLQSNVQWQPLTKIRCQFVTNQGASRRIADAPPAAFRILDHTSVETGNDFLREISQSGHVGSTTARRNAGLPCTGAREVPPLDDDTRLYKYNIPATDMNTLFDLLNGTEGTPQYIEVSCATDVYLPRKAKPKSKDAVASITCPEDLEVEIMGALEVEEEELRDRLQAFLPQIFEQLVPHMRYQRLVIFCHGVPLQEIAMKLWSGGRMFLRKLQTDERIFFGKF